MRIGPLSLLDQKLLPKKLSEMKTNIFSSVTSGDLAFDLTEKNDRSSFLLILTALSNAACRLSLRRSGVELDGGRKTAPPPGTLCYRWSTGLARVKGDIITILIINPNIIIPEIFKQKPWWEGVNFNSTCSSIDSKTKSSNEIKFGIALY